MSDYQIIIIGGGPSGHQAALTAARAQKRVLVVEQEVDVGGACVSNGTIPSKTLRETVAAMRQFGAKTADRFHVEIDSEMQVESLMTRKEQVIVAHQKNMARQLELAGVDRIHGRARFLDDRRIQVDQLGGKRDEFTADYFVIASGSRPRDPQEMDVDHENILDSESILSLTYLPQSMAVLGSGVIAMEYATIFANLGVKVTVIDRSPLALGFMDEDCSRALVADFEAHGGKYLGGAKADSVVWNGTDAVEITMPDKQVIRVEKCLFALGRVANIRGLHLDAAGVELTERKQVKLSEGFQTTVPHIYGVGDVIGPPSLGSASIDQGRRAIAQMLDLPVGDRVEIIPYGIYTIPEMACCGISEQQAEAELGAGNYRAAIASYAEIARGQISASQEGFIKLVADAEGEKILGVHVVGENASEIVHLGLMAMSSGWKVADFVDRTFNFPTLAEGYRLAALEILYGGK